MDTNTLLHLKLPPITPEFYDKLTIAFSGRRIKPEDTIEDIMYRAGQQSVVDWCGNAVRGGTKIHGEPQSFMQKLVYKYWRT